MQFYAEQGCMTANKYTITQKRKWKLIVAKNQTCQESELDKKGSDFFLSLSIGLEVAS